MTIVIAVQDRQKVEQYESMNMPGDPPIEWVEFHFRKSMLESVWHDEQNTQLIVGINGCDYHTPYNKELFDELKSIVNAN